MTGKIVVLVTCGSAKEARKIARALVEQRLAACANILPGHVQSVYRWKGKVESAKEVLLVIKTVRGRFAALQRVVRNLHSYDVPEVIALSIVEGRAIIWARFPIRCAHTKNESLPPTELMNHSGSEATRHSLNGGSAL